MADECRRDQQAQRQNILHTGRKTYNVHFLKEDPEKKSSVYQSNNEYSGESDSSITEKLSGGLSSVDQE